MSARPVLTPDQMWHCIVAEFVERLAHDVELRREFVVNHFSGMEDDDIRDTYDREFPAKMSA
jgi:hypothetical protein